jgi:hypothetical protein
MVSRKLRNKTRRGGGGCGGILGCIPNRKSTAKVGHTLDNTGSTTTAKQTIVGSVFHNTPATGSVTGSANASTPATNKANNTRRSTITNAEKIQAATRAKAYATLWEEKFRKDPTSAGMNENSIKNEVIKKKNEVYKHYLSVIIAESIRKTQKNFSNKLTRNRAELQRKQQERKSMFK